MTLTLETYQVITLAITMIGALFASGKLFFSRIENSILQHLDKLEARFAQHTQEVNGINSRVTTLEEKVKNLPDQQLITAINGDMKALRAELLGLKDLIEPLHRSVDRMNEYLLRDNKR